MSKESLDLSLLYSRIISNFTQNLQCFSIFLRKKTIKFHDKEEGGKMSKESLDHSLLYTRIISIFTQNLECFSIFLRTKTIKFHDKEEGCRGKGGCFYIILHKFYNSTINLLFFILSA